MLGLAGSEVLCNVGPTGVQYSSASLHVSLQNNVIHTNNLCW